jgi:hypothetical protein
MYEKFIHSPDYRGFIGSIDYRDDKLFLPLQAADLVAWQLRRSLTRPTEPPKNELIELHKYPDRVWQFIFDEDAVRRIADTTETRRSKLGVKTRFDHTKDRQNKVKR